MRHSFLYFVGTHFRIFVRKFLVHLRTVYASPQRLARLLRFFFQPIIFPHKEEEDDNTHEVSLEAMAAAAREADNTGTVDTAAAERLTGNQATGTSSTQEVSRFAFSVVTTDGVDLR